MIYENQSLRQYFITGIDDTDTDTVILKYKKPDGTEGEITDVNLSDAPTGKYYVDFLPDELTPEGVWTFWSFVVTTDSNEFPGNPWQENINLEGVYPTNKDYIKSFLGITDTAQDATIDAMLPVLLAQYETIRNAPFDKQLDIDGNLIGYIYPTELPATIAQMYSYAYKMIMGSNNFQSVSSERIGSYAVSFGGPSAAGSSLGYPAFIVSQIKKYIRIY
jgi:hypothetical protein